MSSNCLISGSVIISDMSTESASAKLSNAVTTFAVEVVPSAPTNEAENGDSIPL